MKKIMILSALLAFNTAIAAEEAASTTGATNETSASIESLKKADQKEASNDDEITNPRLRASLGGKSKWSFRSSLSYNGGSVKSPLSSVRPNYTNPGQQSEGFASLGGSVGVNYRLNERSNINGGVGVFVAAPLAGNILDRRLADPRATQRARGNQLDRLQVSSPFVGYNTSYKVAGMQMATEVSYSHATDNDSINLGQMGSLSASQTLILNPEGSNFSGGLYATAGYSIYTSGKTAAYQSFFRDTFSFGLIPFAEYQFNDTYGLRTVFNWANFAYFEDTGSKINHFAKTQSAGLAMSFGRDLYFYPNVQFVPDDIRAERTNVGISTIINL